MRLVKQPGSTRRHAQRLEEIHECKDHGLGRWLRRHGVEHDLVGVPGGRAQVTLVAKSDAFVFGYSKLDAMFGRTTMDAVRLPCTAASSSRVCACCGQRWRLSIQRPDV
jgi:hypothetical protein